MTNSNVFAPKIEESRQAAEALVRMWNEHQTVGDIVDERSFSNVATMLHAIGGSTNAVIHLPAIAEGFGIPFGLEEIRAKSDTPLLLNLLLEQLVKILVWPQEFLSQALGLKFQECLQHFFLFLY